MTVAEGPGCSTCSVRGNVQDTYDISGHLLSTTDALGHATTFTYDTAGNLASQSAPLDVSRPPTTSYTYNDFGEKLPKRYKTDGDPIDLLLYYD